MRRNIKFFIFKLIKIITSNLLFINYKFLIIHH